MNAQGMKSRGRDEDREFLDQLQRLGRYVPPDIVECSEFQAVAALTLSQMREIALPIDLRPGIDDRSYR